MITIRTSEFWTEEPFETLQQKIKTETRLVKFGPLNVFDSELKSFSTVWIGQIFPAKRKFKLFRVTSKEHTSDLSVNGEYISRGGKNLVVVKHKVHFTAIFGLAGLLLAIYALWFLSHSKYQISIVWLAMALTITGIVYSFFTIRDLDANTKEIERLVYKPVYIPQWDDPESDEDDSEEDEEEDELGRQ